VRPCKRINQLPRDADFARRLAHRPFKDVADAKLTPDLLDIDGFTLERKARIASDDEQPFEARKGRRDFLDHSVRKILLLWIAAHVLERQHRDGGLVREWRGRT
jgi:hypothetical protein